MKMSDKSADTNKISRKRLSCVKDIRSVESQFQEYASQTLEEIAHYFWEIHGLLQLEFFQIMQNFRDVCNEPQNHIRNALEVLNNNQLELNKIRTTLESFKEKIPADIDLSVVNRKVGGKLNNLQCQVNITKIHENPFIFQKKADFKNELKNFYSVDYRKLKFSLQLNPIYGSQVQNFTLPPPVPTSYTELSFTDQSMVASDEDHDKVIQSDVRFMEISKSGDKNVVALMKDSTVDQSHSIIARVSHFVSPTYFFVQREDIIAKLAPLYEKYSIMANTTHLSVQNIKLDEIYMGYYEPTQQWHRVVITKDVGSEKCSALLIDVGAIVEISRKHIRKLESDHENIKIAAMACGFFNIEPIDGGSWPNFVKDIFLDILRGNPVRVQKIDKKENDVYNVDLFTTDLNQISVRDALFYMGLARNKPSSVKMSNFQKIPPRAPIELQLSKIKLMPNQTLKVKVSYIENPTEFYIVPEKDVAKEHELKANLNTVYTNAPTEGKNAKWVIHMGMVDMCCAVLFEKAWHRGCIEEVEERGMVRVRFVDEGNTETVEWSKLYHLFEQFRKAKQYAIRCSLVDIQPFRGDNYTWSDLAIDDFKLFAKNPNMWLTVRNVMCDVLNVRLTVQKKDYEIDCGARLVRRGLAFSIGSTTQLDAAPGASLNKTLAKQKEQIATCLADNTDNLKNKNSPQAHVPRTAVTITHIVNPGEFYLYITKLDQGIERFRVLMQEETEKHIDAANNKNKVWSLGDHCLVHSTSRSSQKTDKLNLEDEYNWHRGIIVQANQKFSVFLRDTGSTIENVSSSQLYAIDNLLDSIANTASRCHLAGLQPTGDTDTWSLSAIDCFRNSISIYDAVLATLAGEQMNGSMPVVLWGMTVEDPDPLAPSLQKYSNINRILVSMGLAKLTQINLKNAQYLDIETSKNEIGIEEWLQQFVGGSFLDAIERCVGPPTAHKNEFDDEMVSDSSDQIYIDNDRIVKLLQEIDTTPTWGVKTAPKAWLKTKIIKKTLFTGVPTYVDNDAVVYLHESSDCKTLQAMRTILMKSYKDLPYDETMPYELGQPCLIKYHLDSYFYRGIIKSYDNRTDEYQVKFIDYGNIESAKLCELRPFAPFPNLHAYASRYRVPCIAPNDGSNKFPTEALDAMHTLLVEKLVNVRVWCQETRKGIQCCSFRVDTGDFADIIIASGLAVFRDCDISSRKGIIESKPNYLDDGPEAYASQQKVKSDIQLMGSEIGIITDTDDVGVKNETNQCTDELLRPFHSKNDNCQLPVLNPQPMEFQGTFETNVQGPVGLDYFHAVPQNDEDEELDEAEGVNDNAFINETDTDVIRLEERYINSYWQGLSALPTKNDNIDNDEQELAIQWNQIKLLQRAKAETPSEYEEFLPQDWSTSMSSVAGMDSIHLPVLPSNVRIFRCTIHAVVSPTVLHVFPHLDDFFDHDVKLKKLSQKFAKTAPPLATFIPDTLCLACFSTDQLWYRAVIRSYNAANLEAKIMYIDYWNSEVVSIKELKACPMELAMLSLRTIKVQLYGVQPSQSMRKHDIMQAMRKVIFREREPFIQLTSPVLPNEPYFVHMFASENASESIFKDLVDQKYFTTTN